MFPQITETKCSSETVVAAEFHPLEGRTIVTVGKGFVNFWSLDQTSLTLSRKTGIFDQRDKPKVRDKSQLACSTINIQESFSSINIQ